MLRVDGRETSYGASQVLFGMSLSVAAGEVVTLMGRNGMGKTTTIKSIMGLVPPQAGAITFDDRPSAANGQKRRFQAEVNAFVSAVHPSAHTDISGGLLQALEYLDEKEPGRRAIFIFSDLKEDLAEGYVRDCPMAFTDVHVVAMNVTKLRSDNVDPREYLDRLSAWQNRIEQSGGSWQVINDLDRLEKLFTS